METILRALRLPPDGRRARLVTRGVRSTSAIVRRIRRALAGIAGQPPKSAPMVITSEAKASPYMAYRAANLRLVDEVFDQVLAVSERTRQVLIDHGLPASKVGVSYIGTSHHAAFAQARPRLRAGDDLHLAFLGYMRADKGFYFLLESLFALPDDVARRLRITIAAPVWESYPIDRLKGVAHRFREVVVHDGYKQAGLPKLLADVDLGVIPVLWEDNLPQVAIEFVAHGVPILTSDRGGAQEIGRAPDFIFRAGSTRDFCAKLSNLATGVVPLARFWATPPRIFSMETHVQDLMRFYARPCGEVTPGARPQSRAETGEFAAAEVQV
jgi:glycosyltransferase involved in cell wall biosynthesis